MSQPLISVIVPIYNVEKYVRKCLDSLVQQTMKQIEVICIDDGSTDESGRIADEYASEEFPIFTIIHTENRGLSAARNRGVDEAKADWIMFVDSDDWVDRDFCRLPYKAAMEYGVDLVVFNYWCTSESGKMKRGSKTRMLLGVVESETVILNASAWNKLYSRKLFNDIRYPEGRVFEDFITTYQMIHKAKRIYSYDKKLYYYRKRKGSISNSSKYWREHYYAVRKQYHDLITMGYSERIVKKPLQVAALIYCGRALSTSDPLYYEAVEIVEEIKEFPKYFNKKEIIKFLIWKTNKNLYRKVYRIIKNR